MSEFTEIPATKKSLSQRKPIYSVGINDSNYIVNPIIDGKAAWCPYYRAWTSMLQRCYSPKYQARKPTYIGCTVVKEWHLFSSFRGWMATQDWQGKELDKDILVIGNKKYSPDNCMLVTGAINKLLIDSAAIRGDFPQGVDFDKHAGKYRAKCSVSGKRKYLGLFDTTPEAEYAYLAFKSATIKKIASESESESNPKLKEALLRHSELFKRKADAITNQMIKGRMM